MGLFHFTCCMKEKFLCEIRIRVINPDTLNFVRLKIEGLNRLGDILKKRKLLAYCKARAKTLNF